MESQEQLRSTPDGIKSRMTWNHLIFSLDNIFDEESGHIGIHHHFPLKFSVFFLTLMIRALSVNPGKKFKTRDRH